MTPSPGRAVSWLLNGLIFLIAVAIFVSVVRWKQKSGNAALTKPDDMQDVRVQVLNGCGVPGLAGTVRDYLMQYRVDIREIGNTGIRLPETVVMDRVGTRDKARSVARLLGVAEGNVIQQINYALVDIDVTVIIGKDYKKYFAKRMPID